MCVCVCVFVSFYIYWTFIFKKEPFAYVCNYDLSQLDISHRIEQQWISDIKGKGTYWSLSRWYKDQLHLEILFLPLVFMIWLVVQKPWIVVEFFLPFKTMPKSWLVEVISTFLNRLCIYDHWHSKILKLAMTSASFCCSTGTKPHCWSGENLQLCEGWSYCRPSSCLCSAFLYFQIPLSFYIILL